MGKDPGGGRELDGDGDSPSPTVVVSASVNAPIRGAMRVYPLLTDLQRRCLSCDSKASGSSPRKRTGQLALASLFVVGAGGFEPPASSVSGSLAADV
jgi:hypothetical protein